MYIIHVGTSEFVLHAEYTVGLSLKAKTGSINIIVCSWRLSDRRCWGFVLFIISVKGQRTEAII